MGENTNIKWTDSTWNIGIGCSKLDEDCKFCYMYRDSFDGKKYNPMVVTKTKKAFNLPSRLKEPSKIFTSSLTDVFHVDCDSFRDDMWDVIRKNPQHTYQILTKRPERITDNTPSDLLLADNIWFGTSVGSQKGTKRIAELLKVECKTRFISFEPLYEQLDINLSDDDLSKIHWVIIGGESGNETGKYQYRPCKVEWFEYIINKFKDKSAVFVKQMGTFLAKEMKMSDKHGGNIEEFPISLQIREFPNDTK